MALHTLTSEQFDDRIEYLLTAAQHDLGLQIEAFRIGAEGADPALIATLDRIKHAAAECAKYLRNRTS